MSKPRPRLSLGPEGAKPQTLPSEQNSSRIAYKARDERQSQPPGRGKGNQGGNYAPNRDERGPYAGRDNRGEGPARFGGNSERGGPRGPNRDERGPYAGRDNRGEGPARATSSNSNDPWRNARPRPVDESASRTPARARHVSASEELPPARAQAVTDEGDQPFTPRGLASDERKIYGVNSCEQFYKLHPELVIRAYFTEAAARAKFGPLMKALAVNKRAYHVISAEELEKVTDSQHHEGVCLVIKELPELQLGDWLAALPAAGAEVLAASALASNRPAPAKTWASASRPRTTTA